MIETKYTIDCKKISYEYNNDGYIIYLDGKKWIKQNKNDYIPYKCETIEKSCVEHIEHIVNDYEKEENEQKDKYEEPFNLEMQMAQVIMTNEYTACLIEMSML